MPRSNRTRRRYRGRRTALVALAAVALIAAVTSFVLLDDDGTEFERVGSAVLDPAPTELLDLEDPPESYRIDYRVEGFGTGDEIVTVDRLWVRRPFESRLEVFGGPDPEGEPATVQIGALGAFFAEGADAARVVVASPPGAPSSDVRVAAALDEALEDERFELGARREVLGRPCQVIRTAALLASGDLAPPLEDEWAETCIDRRGLVLEEVLFSQGEPLLRRIAVDVEIDPDLDDVSFETGDPTVPVDSGGGFVARTEDDSRQPGTFFEPTVPEGFERLGRFVVIPPQHENFTDITRRAHRLTYVSDVFVDGPDVVVLEQGGTLGGVDPFPDLQGVEVDVEAFGTAVLSYGRGGPVVIVPRGEGKFLRARGTSEPKVLIELLDDVEEVEGGELRLLDDE